jgi:hypothetical protein
VNTKEKELSANLTLIFDADSFFHHARSRLSLFARFFLILLIRFGASQELDIYQLGCSSPLQGW